MKKLPFALLSMISCAVLISCQNADYDVPYEKYGWSNFPFERLYAYFPPENTLQTYVLESESSNDTIVIKAKKPMLTYEGRTKVINPDLRNAMVCHLGYDANLSREYAVIVQRSSIIYSTNPELIGVDDFDETADFSVHVSNRRRTLSFGYDIRATASCRFFENKNYITHPDEIFQFLTDTICLIMFDKAGVRTNATEIVKGQGATTITTSEDTSSGDRPLLKWHLVSSEMEK